MNEGHATAYDAPHKMLTFCNCDYVCTYYLQYDSYVHMCVATVYIYT